MADNRMQDRLIYHLSQTESTVWQQGGPAALALQQQLAEIHRQGGLGFASFLEVVHPDGMLAVQHTAQSPVQGQVASQGEHAQSSPSAQEQSLSQSLPLAQPGVQVSSPVRDLGRAEGTLIETSTVTAYQMSVNESGAWSRGDHEARMVEATIGDALKDVTTTQAVPVLLDDGRAVYTHGGNVFQTMTEALHLLQDRLGDITSGVQVHMDVSVRLGPQPDTTQTSLATLQERVDQLTRQAPQRSQQQGMGF